MHDLEDFISDSLPFTAVPHGREQQTRKRSKGRLLLVELSHARGKTLLGMAELPGFGVIVTLPVQLTQGGVAEPDKEQREDFFIGSEPIQHFVA